MSSPIKWLIAILLLLVAVFLGLPLMVISELHIDVNAPGSQIADIYNLSSQAIQNMPLVHTMVYKGLKPYFLGLSLVLFLVAIAFILVDGDDTTSTLKDS